jgi:hypothetical protein
MHILTRYWISSICKILRKVSCQCRMSSLLARKSVLRNLMSKREWAIPYASSIGSIMYAILCTRPDVSYALSATSRYQSNYGEAHWTIIKNILKYLKRIKEVFLVFGGEEELVVKGYSDTSFQTDTSDSKSQSSFMFCLNGGAVSWKSFKQDTVVDSTTEVEYIATSKAAKEEVLIRYFVSELDVVPSASNRMDLYCDNRGAIAQAKEPRAHKRAKHVLRRYHLIHEIISQGDVKVCKVHMDHNIADPLTKPLPQLKHEVHIRSMGIRYLHKWSWCEWESCVMIMYCLNNYHLYWLSSIWFVHETLCYL